MKNIIAFGASNSKTSINKQLATYASSLLKNTEVEVLDLNDFDVPTYSVDLEGKSGIPDNAQQLLNKIIASDGLIISLAEHNGAYTAIFKSLFDWMSRIDVKLFKQKPMLLMSTSPGARGGQSVFEIAENRFPIHDANIVAKFSLPSFNDNFKEDKIVDADLKTSLLEAVNTLAERL
ncbi:MULTISPECIES: NADPH-dependent FMN reductase [unclassified Olleya]|jgi:NAD(P)H-dependent FMN reductase|uniref:NADPH-dependent FMN reductase n=1 Tax=unclassified Olleya TaxID=2615019 RepID=UPI0011A7366C|nr:NAD(P)H-dependent oxidoreductase [Olleya sp. Hel_I_94]TVZ46678.1 NAD(P)H-dependent FMN reductase [Olleya sp. Hel_I_94]